MTPQKLLEHSFDKQLSHIPSALSMLDYVDVLFSEKVIVPFRDRIVLGKPFGAQAYYLVWGELGYLQTLDGLSVGVKHDEIPFVDYSEETMGNALGVAAGIAIACDDRVWVNISDAALQMGNTLEAIQFIGHRQLSNILVTVDYNNAQVCGNVDDILAVSPIIEMCRGYGWDVRVVNGHDRRELSARLKIHSDRPTIVVCETIKGHGFVSIESDIPKWHYRKIETLNELQSLVAERRDI